MYSISSMDTIKILFAVIRAREVDQSGTCSSSATEKFRSEKAVYPAEFITERNDNACIFVKIRRIGLFITLFDLFDSYENFLIKFVNRTC